MLAEYISKAIEKAEYKKVEEDNAWFASVPGFEGAWGHGSTIEECRKDLMEVVEEWLLIKIQNHEDLPRVKGIELNIKQTLPS